MPPAPTNLADVKDRFPDLFALSTPFDTTFFMQFFPGCPRCKDGSHFCSCLCRPRSPCAAVGSPPPCPVNRSLGSFQHRFQLQSWLYLLLLPNHASILLKQKSASVLMLLFRRGGQRLPSPSPCLPTPLNVKPASSRVCNLPSPYGRGVHHTLETETSPGQN